MAVAMTRAHPAVAPAAPPALELVGVSKSFRGVGAVRDVSLTLPAVTILSLLGPSGCGKTTTLRIVAGFVAPDTGQVRIGSEDVTDLPPHLRHLGMVFQNYALFPHMTVFENVAFGLRMRNLGAAEIGPAVRAALRLVRMTGLEARYPRELSGGQQQRVALARAIVTRPRVLLLDEPFGALDRQLREEMQIELKQLQRTVGISFVFVTHDQEEALTISDRIAVMRSGVIEQVGTPDEVFEQPRSLFVASFFGTVNVFEGTVSGSDGSAILVAGPLGRWRVPARAPVSGACIVAVRAADVAVRRADRDEADDGDWLSIHGRVENIVYKGTTVLYQIRARDGSLVLAAGEPALRASVPVGAPVSAAWRAARTHVFPR